MEEKFAELINQYELNISSCYRRRGCLLIETPCELLQLRSYDGSEKRQQFEHKIKTHLSSSGFTLIDYAHKNKEDTFLSLNQYGEKYVLRTWYPGEELSYSSLDQIRAGAENLAELHNRFRHLEVDNDELEAHSGQPPAVLFTKRNRELKSVKSYIRLKKQRNSFESSFLSICDVFFEEAREATAMLQELDGSALLSDVSHNRILCHGSYTYHSTILLPDGRIATTGFDKAGFGLQITDLYLFFRKTMEKSDWNPAVGDLILNAYTSIRALGKIELSLLCILLLYPEKFWKIVNNYYNNRKSWVPRKNAQKLTDICEINGLKASFIQYMRNNLL